VRKLRGLEVPRFLRERLRVCESGLSAALAAYSASSAFRGWLETTRAVEEFINIVLCELDDESLEARLIHVRLDQPEPDFASVRLIRGELSNRFSPQVAQRFLVTMLQASALGNAFRAHGLHDAALALATIGGAVGYFQSRRRQMLAVLYMIPTTCRGANPIASLDAMNVLMPHVETACIQMTGLYQQLMLSNLFDDFSITLNADGFSASHQLNILDRLFLEPERLSIDDAFARKSSQIALEDKDPRRVFSAVEVTNTVKLISEAYAEIGLSGTAFSAVAALVPAFLEYCVDDYFIDIPVDRFREITDMKSLDQKTAAALVFRGKAYPEAINASAPFIEVGERVLSTVTFLGRFLYLWKSVCLNPVRQFQIHAGFLFEAKVSAELERQGFEITTVKRISRKEFDVVAKLDGVIYNIQCKNNLIDYSQIERNPELVARHTRRMDRYYKKALEKEMARENLLKTHLGLQEVRHVVVCRFPIATENPRILAFAGIDEFKQRYAS
jgi:hypothetical protein